jgi:hypothetical protein
MQMAPKKKSGGTMCITSNIGFAIYRLPCNHPTSKNHVTWKALGDVLHLVTKDCVPGYWKRQPQWFIHALRVSCYAFSRSHSTCLALASFLTCLGT